MTIPVSAALKAFLAQGAQTLCTIIRVARTDGTIIGFTDHDQDLAYDDGDGSVTYKGGVVSYVRKDVAQADDLSVDNTEYDAVLTSPAISETDLTTGVWDFADVRYSIVNWADLTMGGLRLPAWKLGQITANRDQFTAELRGIMQAYSRIIGEATSPTCRANLGDSRCTVNLTSFTVTGTLTGVSASPQLTLFDTSRTEPGPTGGVVVAAITNSNPGHVTLATGTGATFSDGEAVTLSTILGPTLLNATTFIENLSGDTWDLPIDTSNTAIYPAYTANSGTCTPMGSSSGYFDFGVCTINSGPNAGFSRDVMSYVPGQWTLMLPFPFALTGSETYTMVAGCDKSLHTCINRFSNAANMQGEPYLPGIDQIVQVQAQP